MEGSRAGLCLLSSLDKGPVYQIKNQCLLIGWCDNDAIRLDHTSECCGTFCGRVSTGLMHATPGEMKSFKSSADRIALIVLDTALETVPRLTVMIEKDNGPARLV